MVKIKGTLQVESGYQPKIRIEAVEEWKGKVGKQFEEKKKVVKLYLKLDDESKYDDLTTVLDGYVGDMPVVMVKGGKGYSLPYKVKECRALHFELEELIGAQNVKIVEK